MGLKFPYLQDHKATLLSWQKSLSELAMFSKSLIPTFSFGTWRPTFGAGGSMTFTPTSLYYARYMQIGSLLWIRLHVVGTTGGVAAATITFTLPPNMTPKATADFPNTGQEGIFGYVVDTTAVSGFGVLVGNIVSMRRYDSANFGTGTGRELVVNSFIEVIP